MCYHSDLSYFQVIKDHGINIDPEVLLIIDKDEFTLRRKIPMEVVIRKMDDSDWKGPW